jgi:CubicO group peptidase (beta-lactamase class C family)
MSACYRALVCGCLLGPGLSAMAAGQRTSGVCDELLPQMRQSHIPDLALATFAKGNVHIYYCTAESHLLGSEAVFEAASLSKPIFSVAVLTLVQQGKLDLDRPLSTYLSEPYQHQQNPFGPGIDDAVTDPRLFRVTTRMVLSHTSGLPNWSRHQPLTFLTDPGQKWSYSGEGYVYLQRVVETITGEDLQTFMLKTVFDPLGMTHSSFVWRPEFAGQVRAPHAADGSQGESQHYANALASSTLYTTLDDYAKFILTLLNPPPGSPAALEETKQVEVNAKLKLGWGLGVAVEEVSRSAYFHWGANPGFQSFFMVQPASGRGVLFLTNSDNGLDLIDSLAARVVPGKHPALKFPMLHPKD